MAELVNAVALEATGCRGLAGSNPAECIGIEPVLRVTGGTVAARKTKKAAKKRGPKPETLVIEGRWEDAVAKALRKAPPPPKAKR